MEVSKRKLKRIHRRKRRQGGKAFCIVYGLCDTNGDIRYIGQTRQQPALRLEWYYKGIDIKRAARKKLSPVEAWLDEMSFFGIYPALRIIDDNATWDVSEIIYIERHRQAGCDLLNVTRGGMDAIGHLRREGK